MPDDREPTQAGKRALRSNRMKKKSHKLGNMCAILNNIPLAAILYINNAWINSMVFNETIVFFDGFFYDLDLPMPTLSR